MGDYTLTKQDEYECPSCGHRGRNNDGWEMVVGCELECDGCGITLVVSNEDLVRWFTWRATPPETPGDPREKGPTR